MAGVAQAVKVLSIEYAHRLRALFGHPPGKLLLGEKAVKHNQVWLHFSKQLIEAIAI